VFLPVGDWWVVYFLDLTCPFGKKSDQKPIKLCQEISGRLLLVRVTIVVSALAKSFADQ
jgi:hypothetical protein